MPEIPKQKVHLHPGKAQGDASHSASEPAPGLAYAELHCVSNFSFLRGASHPDELVQRAGELGYEALALTDEHSLAGVVRAHVAAKQKSVRLIVGAEVHPEDGASAVLLATDRASYGRLARLLTVGRRRAEKGSCKLRVADIAGHREGLFAIGLTDESALEPRASDEAIDRARGKLHWIRETFGDESALAVALHDGQDDMVRLERLLDIAAHARLLPVATGAVDAHDAERRPVRDTLTAIREKCRVAELGRRLPADGVRPLRDAAMLSRLYRSHPELLLHSVKIASKCRFTLDELRYDYPIEGTKEILRTLVEEGLLQRWPEGIPAKVRTLIEHELALISELSYERYFLTVHELVDFARRRGILCQGRGSAANSAVCYALGITSVDPDRFDVLFERFVSKDRNEPPDIDVDFEHERREEVIQHVYERYGRDRAALTATVITYRGRSAIRDVGKALGLSLDQVDRLASSIEWWDEAHWPEDRLRQAGFDPSDPALRRVLSVARAIQGFPRHLSQHVGGMVITSSRLDELVPVENASMPGRTVIEWDKDDLDALGILKVDCLALGMLTAIRKSFDLIASYRGHRFDLATIPAEDPGVYEMAQRADTLGVFQIESRAQMAMLPRLRPRCFYDLVIEVAIVRPGPIQGGMVHPYLRRREGLEPVDFPSEDVRFVLEKTLGVPIFQEQAMRLAVVAAGFTPGEADQLRRAMGAWRRPGIIQKFGEKLISGLSERGYSREFAESLYRQIQGFGEYGFPESHAASFALLTYVSCWLKRYEPASFTAALLNSQPMGFYGPSQLVRDAQAHGVTVFPADVTRSLWDCTLEARPQRKGSARATADPGSTHPSAYGRNGPAIRLGLRLVKGLSEASVERLVRARAEGTFQSIEDCKARARLGSRESRLLAESGAFTSLEKNRRTAFWEASIARDTSPLFQSIAPPTEAAPALEAPSWPETIAADYRAQGLSLNGHPMAVLRPEMTRLGARPISAMQKLPHGTWTTIAGLVINRQRPGTAHGILFMTLEDETGYANLILHEKTQQRFRAAVLLGRLLVVRGKLERAHDVIHLVTTQLTDLSRKVSDVPTSSRDFH